MSIPKRFSFILSLQFCFLVGSAQCDVARVVGANKAEMGTTYRYDGFSIQHIPFTTDTKAVKEIHSEFIAFEKQTYKVIFCVAGFTEDVKISIYNKKKPTVKVAEQIVNSSMTRWIFEPLKSGIYDIIYTPVSSDLNVDHKGCIIMLMGFKK